MLKASKIYLASVKNKLSTRSEPTGWMELDEEKKKCQKLEQDVTVIKLCCHGLNVRHIKIAPSAI